MVRSTLPNIFKSDIFLRLRDTLNDLVHGKVSMLGPAANRQPGFRRRTRRAEQRREKQTLLTSWLCWWLAGWLPCWLAAPLLTCCSCWLAGKLACCDGWLTVWLANWLLLSPHVTASSKRLLTIRLNLTS